MVPSSSSSSNSISQSSLISALASSSSASTGSPCAACKFLRRKCQPDCVFAPYFPPDQPQKFVHVHRVFGASNVTKMLNEIPTYQREDAVNSLAYEADMRLRDPVYGCVGVISVLQHQVRQLQNDLLFAKAEVFKYQNPAGNPNLNGGNGLLNVNLNHQGFGFGREGQFLNMGVGRENNGNSINNNSNHHSSFYQQHMMLRGYDSELAATARIGVNGGGFDGGIVPTMGGSAAAVGLLGGNFLKPSTAGGEERPSIGPS